VALPTFSSPGWGSRCGAGLQLAAPTSPPPSRPKARSFSSTARTWTSGRSKADIETKDKYKDFKLHVEFDPELSDPNATGEGRANSGVYLQGRYEIQVMDSYNQKLYPGACASVYGQKAPDKNMAKPVGEWQSYDIEFHAAKFDGDKKIAPARVTIIWNGEKVQDNVDIKGSTGGGYKETAEGGPIRLQYHHNPVRFRNIWIVPLEEK
jgi:hypothetical protein